VNWQVSEMSKFIEKLKQVLQPPPQSMGFKTAQAEQARPRIQLVVNISGGKSKSSVKELDMADALVSPNPAVGVDKTISGSWLLKGDSEEVEKSIKSGVDFVILPTNGEVIPPDKKIGKILQIEAAITDVLLRTVNELPVDAILLTEDKESGLGLSWKRLMLIQRFSSILNKPLLIEVLPDIIDTELQQIWDAGISGIIISLDAEQADSVVQKLRKAIEKLPFPSRRKRDKSLAILPRVEIEPEKPEEDEGDDDE
jgi:hypothetical protein